MRSSYQACHPEQQTRQKMKRYSSGTFKRSHSQSIGTDTDGEPPDAHGSAHSARRLRRRVRGPGKLLFLGDAVVPPVGHEELEQNVAVDVPYRDIDLEEWNAESQSVDITEDVMDMD